MGISGGKDSSVVAALCVEALGKDRVIGVLMPCGVQADIDMAKKRIDKYINIDRKVENELKKIKEEIVIMATKTETKILIIFHIKPPPCFSVSNIKPIGSYELFKQNGITYYGKHDYSIFCENNGFPAFSTYKIFDKKNKTVFKTKSYEEFLNKLEEMFMTSNIKKINFYGTCLSDPGYKSLGYAINNSTLIEFHEIEELQNGQLIHIRTINGILINIEYLWDDMICTCKGA